MKVLFYLENVNIGGQQTMNYYYAKNLEKLKYEIHVAFYADGLLKSEFEKVSNNVVQLDEPPKSLAKAVRNPFHIIGRAIQLYKFVKKHEIEMVLSNGSYTYFIAALVRLFSKAKHGRLLGKEPSKERTLWKTFNILPLYKMTDLFFGFSYGNKELASRGVPKRKLVNLGYGVDTTRFKPLYTLEERRKYRREIGVPDDVLLIAWVGRLYEKLNDKDGELVFSLMMAKAMKEKGFNDFKFMVVGDGPWREGMKARAKEYGIDEHMIYLGWKMPEEVPHYLNLIDVFPLLDYDVLGGSKLRESMASGRAVVSVSGPSGYQAEWVTHGHNGILVSPDNFIEEAAEACIALHKDPEKREALGKAGRIYTVNHMDFSIKAKILDAGCQRAVNGE